MVKCSSSYKGGLVKDIQKGLASPISCDKSGPVFVKMRESLRLAGRDTDQSSHVNKFSLGYKDTPARTVLKSEP